MGHNLVRTVLLALATLALLATPAAAQGAVSADGGVLVRISGDVIIAPGETHGAIVVVDGDLTLSGAAATVVVVNGTATLTDAVTDNLVVVNGDIELGAGTNVTGDIQLVNSDITRHPTATVDGEIRDDPDQFFNGFWVIGVLFLIGWAVLTLLAAFTLAAVAPAAARNTGRTITTEPTRVVAAGLLLWIVVPVVSIALFATIIGIPTALAIWTAVLPALGFVGFLVAGVRIGDFLTARGGGHGHPYLAATVGAVVLIVVGLIPVVGPIVVTIAAFLGSGSLALHAWRTARTNTGPPNPAQATTVGKRVAQSP